MPPPGMSREEAQALAGLIAIFAITAAWWALALWPVRGSPAWLERTRYACFGVNENGLPDAGGWIGLIGGPLGMLLILVIGWSDSLRCLLQRAGTSRAVGGTFAALGIGCMLLATGAAVRVEQARASSRIVDRIVGPVDIPRIDRETPPLTLTAHTGDLLNIHDLAGRPILVTFAFAHCTTVCPLIVQDVLNAQRTLRGSGESPAVLIVTLDPWRDTPSRLPSIANAWQLPETDAWVLSGTVAEVEAALDSWGVPRSRDFITGDVTHPSLVYVVDREGRIAYTASGGTGLIVSLVQKL